MFRLLPDSADVLLAGRFSGLSVSHAAALIARRSHPFSSHQSRVYVCVSDHTAAQQAELQQTVTAMGCKSRQQRCGCLHDNSVFSPETSLFSGLTVLLVLNLHQTM